MKAYKAGRYIAKVYDSIPALPEPIELIREEDRWPEWFIKGRIIDLDVQLDNLGSVRIFGTIMDNTGHTLLIDASVLGHSPTKVWSTP